MHQRLIIGFAVLAIVGLSFLFFESEAKFSLILYKTIMISTALSLSYLADIAFFQHQRPSKLIQLIDRKGDDEIQDPAERSNMYILLAAINIRRAIIIGSFLLAFTLGL